MKLTDEQREFYAKLEHTFNTDGWALLKAAWTAEREQIKEYIAYSATTIEDLIAARNRRDFLRELVELADTHETKKQSILDDGGDEIRV